MKKLFSILEIFTKYDDNNLKADRGIIYLSKINPNDIDEKDRKELIKLGCEFSTHYDCWYIIT